MNFFKNWPRNLKFSYIFRLSPLCMNEEKWKKIMGNKTGITSYSWTVQWGNFTSFEMPATSVGAWLVKSRFSIRFGKLNRIGLKSSTVRMKSHCQKIFVFNKKTNKSSRFDLLFIFWSRALENILVKSVHFKKTVARISFLSKLWYFQFKSKQKVPQFWKKRDSRNCLLKMNGL